jgi:hypothetical protein
MMQKIKTMPHSEKYAIVLDRIKSHDGLISPIIRKHLNEQALVEIKKLWQEGTKPIPEDAPDEEKYEIAYGNLMWQGKSNLEFIDKHLGEKGIELYKLAQVEELKRKNAGLALKMLGVIRRLSPVLAFTITAKKWAYQLQWLIPSMSLTDLTPNKAVYEIPSCKILDYPNMKKACIVDCQGAFPMWATEQFKVGLSFEPQGNSCTVILTR